MREDAPENLVVGYTRTMMAFLAFNRSPRRLSIIGLGGGSMAKWCRRRLPHTDITAIEINPHVIALRDRFYIPGDDQKFRVLCENGAHYVARTLAETDVLLVDGFDIEGQPPELSSQQFYDDCYGALTSSGVMVVNLCGFDDFVNIARIRESFHGQIFVATPEDGENKVVFACKGESARFQRESLRSKNDRECECRENECPETA
jgi:spermidine synthase